MNIVVLDPTIAVPDQGPGLAPRLDQLDGKVIGALWNGRPQEDAVLDGILKHLAATYRLRGTRMWRKPQLYISAPDDMVDEIVEEVDAVITGVGT
jgi:hypothetical protein